MRLWGTSGVPAGSAPAPVVVIAHGAHGDGCPGEFGDWPCFAVEQRNDLGFRYLVRRLASAGFVAVALDVNVACTGGFGEGGGQVEHARFDATVDATLAAITAASAGAPSRLPVDLAGRADTSPLGILGHSRGGMNALDWANRSRARLAAVVLLAPFFDLAVTVPDVPVTLILGTCDRDTRTTGAGYLMAARAGVRTAPSWRIVLRGANHNADDRTLVRLRNDDAAQARGACARDRRPRPSGQQAFLARVATDAFSRAMTAAPPAPWQAAGARPERLYSQSVVVSGDRVGP